jgi:hypothetical protein
MHESEEPCESDGEDRTGTGNYEPEPRTWNRNLERGTGTSNHEPEPCTLNHEPTVVTDTAGKYRESD